MIDKLTRYVLHPFFAAAYPIVFLLSINAGQIPLQQAVRVLALCLFMSLVLTLLLGMITKDFRRGGLLASILLALFFTYGHVYNWFKSNIPFLANHIFLDVLWGVLLLCGIWAAYKIGDIGIVNKNLNIIILFLLIQPMLNIGLFVYRSGIQQEIDPFDNIQVGKQNLPDIYYIILDGHGRSDIVQELFKYDNSAFIDYLRRRGFYVADQSRSNYVQTALSLSSSLNFNYLEIKEINPQSDDRALLIGLIKRNKVKNFLNKQGYKMVAFSTGYDPTTLPRADIFFPFETVGVNGFEGLVLSTSIISAIDVQTQEQWFVDPFRCDNQRGYILNVFENLKKIPELPGPKFVFAHIIAPHPPFVFDANGNEMETNCGLQDGSSFLGKQSDYETGYPLQMRYIEMLTKEVVDIILEKSAIPPVIIIQGDHGSGMLLDWDSSQKTCLRERVSILNAYYIPNVKYDQLYETITPVNSFRVVLNEVFDLQLPLLEDRSYYSGWYTPYQLVDVTDKIEDACKFRK